MLGNPSTISKYMSILNQLDRYQILRPFKSYTTRDPSIEVRSIVNNHLSR